MELPDTAEKTISEVGSKESKEYLSKYSKKKKPTCGLKKSNSSKPVISIFNAILKLMLGHGSSQERCCSAHYLPRKSRRWRQSLGLLESVGYPGG